MNLNFSDTLGIIGLVATFIFGAWEIFKTYRTNYPGALTFVEQNAIGLFNSIIKNFDEIKIQYQNHEINEQMVYLKASFINTGKIDLSTTENQHKLKVGLGDGFKWINAKVTGHSKDIHCELVREGNELIFDFDLIRKNEFIQFEAFAEMKTTDNPSRNFRKSLKFNHRIPNTSKVEIQRYLNDEQIQEKKLEYKKNLVFATLTFLFVVAITFYNYFTKSTDLEYLYIKDSVNYVVKVKSIEIDKVELTDSSQDFEQTLTLDEFNNLKNFKAQIVEPTLWDRVKKFGVMLFMTVFYLFLMITEYRAIRKDKKIKNIIESK